MSFPWEVFFSFDLQGKLKLLSKHGKYCKMGSFLEHLITQYAYHILLEPQMLRVLVFGTLLWTYETALYKVIPLVHLNSTSYTLIGSISLSQGLLQPLLWWGLNKRSSACKVYELSQSTVPFPRMHSGFPGSAMRIYKNNIRQSSHLSFYPEKVWQHVDHHYRKSLKIPLKIKQQ